MDASGAASARRYKLENWLLGPNRHFEIERLGELERRRARYGDREFAE